MPGRCLWGSGPRAASAKPRWERAWQVEGAAGRPLWPQWGEHWEEQWGESELLGAFKVIFVKAVESIKIIWKLGARLKFSFN